MVFIGVYISLFMIDPRELMYWVDDYKKAYPGTIDNQPLKLIGLQVIKRFLKPKITKNYIYRIGNTREIVYKTYEFSPAVMKMGISSTTWERHSKSVSMEDYAKYFIDRIDLEWLKRNSFEVF